MLHPRRRWAVKPVETPEDLARWLTEMTWCGCAGFAIRAADPEGVTSTTYFLNDSISPDGIQEYAAVRQPVVDGPAWQVESITFGWCDYERALRYIRDLSSSRFGNLRRYEAVDMSRVEPAEGHHCRMCA